MSVKEQDRIKRYIESRLGERGKDRDGLARLIEGYQSWVDPTDHTVAAVVEYARDNKLNVKSRKGEDVDCRYYLYVYLFCVHNVRPTMIAKYFNFDHSTVLYALGGFELVIGDPKFLSRTKELRKRFPVDLHKAVVIIDIKRGYGKQNKIDTNNLDDSFLHLYLVKSLVSRDKLTGSLRGSYDKIWKRYFLFGELKKHNWTNRQVSGLFELNGKNEVFVGLSKLNDEIHRRLNKSHLIGYENMFRNITVN